MSDEIQWQALTRDIARRLQLASHDALRVIDRVLLRLEAVRERHGAHDLLEIRSALAAHSICARSAAIESICAELADEDEERDELRDEARAEMLGGEP